MTIWLYVVHHITSNMLRCQLCCRPSWAHLPFSRCECSWPHNLHTWLSSNSLQGVSQMFDQLMKRSNWVCVYKMGRFAEERRAFLCDLNKRGHSLRTLRNVNKLLLEIAERVNVRQAGEITEAQIVRAARSWVAKSCVPSSTAETDRKSVV